MDRSQGRRFKLELERLWNEETTISFFLSFFLFKMPLHHLSIYQGDLFTRLKLVFIKNQNIRKNKWKIESPFDSGNGQFTCQKCGEVWITERILPKGLENPFELERVTGRKLRKFRKLRSFLRKFHGDFKFVRITEIRIRESQL